MTRLRRFYWRHIRRHRYEICRTCGRPVGLVWHAREGLWNYVIAGQTHTTYQMRHVYCKWAERAEGVGGIRCIPCFDREARERSITLKWEPSPL